MMPTFLILLEYLIGRLALFEEFVVLLPLPKLINDDDGDIVKDDEFVCGAFLCQGIPDEGVGRCENSLKSFFKNWEKWKTCSHNSATSFATIVQKYFRYFPNLLVFLNLSLWLMKDD